MRTMNQMSWGGSCAVMGIVCLAVLSAQQPAGNQLQRDFEAKLNPLIAWAQSGQPAAGAQQPTAAAGQQPVGAPGAPGQGRGRGGGFRQPDPIDFQEHDGWTSLFDGKT